ncbi:N-acetyllactosaminide beta-1,3-N-acetylglucosaminyltransferase 3-like isoform X1 [Osmerus eperlanus]|uniref:N-acetyllactosaminide beta-1,3-N-acetylglucosaminyltransferase 3-like isoform X1 n=1 Tax=Osmerus eperlanus TaxID=29151 RepID=UPI002E0F59AC
MRQQILKYIWTGQLQWQRYGFVCVLLTVSIIVTGIITGWKNEGDIFDMEPYVQMTVGDQKRAEQPPGSTNYCTETDPSRPLSPVPWEDPGPYHVAYPRNYRFIMDEPGVCETKSPFLVLMVPVAPHNLAARDAIRRTWGNETLVRGQLVLTLFLLGLPGGSDAEQQLENVRQESRTHRDLIQSDFTDSYINLTIKTMVMLEWLSSRCPGASYAMKIDSDMFLNLENVRQESRTHRDLIQSDFTDSYLNLTIKTMVMLEWLSSRCPGASYAMKIDSDMFLNLENVRQESRTHRDLIQSDFTDSYLNLTIKTMVMLEWLSSRCPGASYAMKIDSDMFLNVHNLVTMLLDAPRENYMTGLVWWHSPVLRNPNEKFFLPKEVIAEPEYPPYPLGLGYVMSIDIPKKILGVSCRIKPIYIEDAYLGMCLKLLGISPTDPPSVEMFQVNPRFALRRCALSRVVAVTTKDVAQLLWYWEENRKPGVPCLR